MTKEQFIARTFQLAKLGLGHASPNPLVGAVLVKNGKIIGEGYHQYFGGPHAEVNAFSNATESVEGATLYCNLEPCCHTNKKTPPCTDLIIAKKIKEVVISNLDSNPMVSGRGVDKLRQAGIEVTTGVLKEEGEKLNEVFFYWMRTNLPFIHLKWAQTLDGKWATDSGHSKWITSEKARFDSHFLRQKYDAVCVGKNTLVSDNPKLNVRSPLIENAKHPYRIVIGSIDQMPTSSEIFNDELKDKTIIYTKHTNSDAKELFLQKGIKVLEYQSEFKIEEFLESLKAFSISSILIEGGPNLIQTFLDQKKFQRVTIYQAPKILGAGKSLGGQLAKLTMDEAQQLRGEYRELDGQLIFEGRV